MLNTLIRKLLKPFVMSTAGRIFKAFDSHSLERSLTVFVYHDVTDYPGEFSRQFSLNVYPQVFEYQIRFIREKFNIISPDELLSDRVPPKAALITFDDGMRSFFVNAIPILEKYGIPAVIFLNMGPIKGEIFWAGLITYLCERRSHFIEYLKRERPSCCIPGEKMPLFLSCDRELVETYLESLDEPIDKEVAQFVGDFAEERDLDRASQKDFIFFGNHLFNHDVPALMSDDDLLNSYFQNDNELKKYPNYRNMFSFPFGQPRICFTQKQIDLLLENGPKKVFSTYPVPNYDTAAHYLHRIPLSSFHNSAPRIWFAVFQRGLRDRFSKITQCKFIDA